MRTYAALFLTFAALTLCNGFTQEETINAPPHIEPFIYSPLVAENGTQYPGQRQNFGMAYFDHNLFILGGVSSAQPTEYATAIWTLNTETAVWNKTHLELKSAHHCVAQNGTVAYIIGGQGNGTSSFSSLNLTTGEWKQLPALPAGHTLDSACAVFGKTVLVFGGCDSNGACTAKVDIYDTNSSSWRTTYADDQEIEDAPTARGGATMNIVENEAGSWAIVLGGNAANDTQYNAYIYNLGNHTWTSLSVSGVPHLAYHTTVTTGAGHLLVFGGEIVSSQQNSGETYLVALNATTGNATRLTFSTATPTARKSHAAVYNDNRMIIYGGDYQQGESSSNAWQLAVEGECLAFGTCGDCLLAGCYWCSPNGTSYCVAGSVTPYVDETCTERGWNHSNILKCRREHPAAPWLVATTIVVLVVIAILVVATYVLDYKKGKAGGGGYEPIGGI